MDPTRILLTAIFLIFLISICVTLLLMYNKMTEIKIFFEVFASLSLFMTAVFYYSFLSYQKHLVSKSNKIDYLKLNEQFHINFLDKYDENEQLFNFGDCIWTNFDKNKISTKKLINAHKIFLTWESAMSLENEADVVPFVKRFYYQTKSVELKTIWDKMKCFFSTKIIYMGDKFFDYSNSNNHEEFSTKIMKYYSKK